MLFDTWAFLAVLGAIVVAIVLVAFAGAVVVLLLRGKIDIHNLIAEADGKASLSRFQFLLFTFVVAGLYFLLCVEAGTLIEVPASVLGILGISASGYVLSKGVTASKETLIARGARPARRSPGNAEPDAVISITQPDPAVATQAELKL